MPSPIEREQSNAEQRPFQFSLAACLIAVTVFALLFINPLLAPVLIWLGLFLGPQADRKRNLLPMIWLAAAFYLPTLLCFFIGEQSRPEYRIGWDGVASKWLRMAPCLPGMLPALAGSELLKANFPSVLTDVLLVSATLAVLCTLTLLARWHRAMRYALVTLAFLYAAVLSLIVPAGMRI